MLSSAGSRCHSQARPLSVGKTAFRQCRSVPHTLKIEFDRQAYTHGFHAQRLTVSHLKLYELFRNSSRKRAKKICTRVKTKWSKEKCIGQAKGRLASARTPVITQSSSWGTQTTGCSVSSRHSVPSLSARQQINANRLRLCRLLLVVVVVAVFVLVFGVSTLQSSFSCSDVSFGDKRSTLKISAS